MILTDIDIIKYMETNDIIITPFDPEDLGTNSYDVHLGDKLMVYSGDVIDSKKPNQTETFEIPESGYILQPNKLYLGVTKEYTETHKHIPFLEGKSSTGRLGISIHATAGKGDLGFMGTWTLEISCIEPVRIYPGMPVGQIIYFCPSNADVITPYNKKKNAKYNLQKDLPVPSLMYKNF